MMSVAEASLRDTRIIRTEYPSMTTHRQYERNGQTERISEKTDRSNTPWSKANGRRPDQRERSHHDESRDRHVLASRPCADVLTW